MKSPYKRSFSVSSQHMGNHHHGGHHEDLTTTPNVDSLTYVEDESDAWRAHEATEHYQHRGKFWNKGKHATLIRYLLVALVGITQAAVAYFTNLSSNYFIKVRTTRRTNNGCCHSFSQDHNNSHFLIVNILLEQIQSRL